MTSSTLKRVSALAKRLLPVGYRAADGERYYFAYEPSRVLRSPWVAHYLIYSRFLELAAKVDTLDLGCGSGAGTKMLSLALGARVFGIDYSREAIKYCRKHNAGARTAYHVLDLNDRPALNKLSQMIRREGISQCFMVETIEHLRNPDLVVRTLLDAGVQRVFASTPSVPEGATGEVNKHHVHPFSPAEYRRFSDAFGARLLGYCRFVSGEDVARLLDKGLTDADIRARYIAGPAEAISGPCNYLIGIYGGADQDSRGNR